jgi:putative intracellular protease/amidase
MKILMVLTSHDQLGDTGKKTGFWLEEFAAPYADGKPVALVCHAPGCFVVSERRMDRLSSRANR